MDAFPKKPLFKYAWHGTSLSLSKDHVATLESVGLSDTSDWISYQAGETINEGSTACYKVPIPGSKRHIYFKRYSVEGEPWRFFLRKSKAACETLNYHRLQQIGIPTLNVLASYEKRILGRLEWACIVTEEVPNTQQLDQFVATTLCKMPVDERRAVSKSILQQLVSQLQKAHAANFFHQDLKWRNVLIQTTSDGFQPVWIDCPRGRFMSFRKRDGVVSDLSALARLAIVHMTQGQRLRFIYDYLGPQATREQAHRLFREIHAHLSRRPPRAMQPTDNH